MPATVKRLTSARNVGTIGDFGWMTMERAAALYGWPPAGSTQSRPLEDMALARSGVRTPRMMETFAAAFSNTSPPSRTRVTPNPLPGSPLTHASRPNPRSSLPSSASISAMKSACMDITNRSNSSRSTPLVSIPG